MKAPPKTLAMALSVLGLLGTSDAVAADLKQHLIAAIDAPDGRSDGDLSGRMAEFFKGQTRSSSPVRLQVRTLRKFAEAGCARLEATLIQDDVPTKDGNRIPLAVRYELNLCRDGQPPSEGIDLDAASRVLSGESPAAMMRESGPH
ncbi:MAG: hypothetical protein AW10_04261 [Candidatus Accumulibacter appositus]|uniref:Uncharacterized protein n=1 Tax=Candidatus Accumulibacter appositus TaxID=1454003 RepID=A0A011P5D3_9PROT|nr:MAG: hypothetical protein AW10_04261 [Candidatus Accumulibacter appositus]